ncbi:MAG: ABC transporter ATP-binding protein [Tepidisphaeraceae bacterium]|jgi:NitT/TauT family transport system ATP-binding protein
MPGQADTSAAPVLLQDLQRTFEDDVQAIAGITLNVSPGKFVAILGPSGCGKSTLLRIIAGLDHPTSGTIQRGADFNTRSIAYVFQDAHLLPWRNVLRNVALPLELRGVAKSARLDAAAQALEQVGLSDALRRYPKQLSGGMKMRVSLARALVVRPKLLLLDEPFAALDEITRQKLDQQLRELWLAHRMTVLFVTHSTAEATFLADRAVVLTRRPATVVDDLRLNLPEYRDESLRSRPEFAAAGKQISDALRKGGA